MLKGLFVLSAALMASILPCEAVQATQFLVRVTGDIGNINFIVDQNPTVSNVTPHSFDANVQYLDGTLGSVYFADASLGGGLLGWVGPQFFTGDTSSPTISGSGIIHNNLWFSNGCDQPYDGYRGPTDCMSSTVLMTPVDTPSVAEPATWTMMLLGFGAIGFAMRRHARGCIYKLGLQPRG